MSKRKFEDDHETFVGTGLSDTSEDDDSDKDLEPPRQKRKVSLGGTESYEDDDNNEDSDSEGIHKHTDDDLELNQKRRRHSLHSIGGTDRSSLSLDHSFGEDDSELGDGDDTSNIHLMNNMVSYAKQQSCVDNKAQKMMEKMGYRAGHGLGKHDQGRVDPVEMSKQRGRRGLGMIIKGLEPADLEWDSNLEVVSVEEPVSWLEDSTEIILTEEDLCSWIREGSKKLTIDDEFEFCNPAILKSVISSKSVFDKLTPEEMRRARTRSNPFETIRGAFFLNRAAMKMANMDKVFDFMFTDPQNEHNDKLIGPEDLLYFADVCAGPGGFSEYVLWRRKWRAKGFGFTLKGDNDFRLTDFYSGPPETFEPYYGINEDGNVFDPENISSFRKFVRSQTLHGVHFMMADGGFSVEGDENIQEILSKQLYLCQFLVALYIVREGGNFVCKLFDLFTPFSVGLIYLMYKSFKKISIHKPNTSRPANSERYIICKWKRRESNIIADYMWNINKKLWKFGKSSDKDIVEIVPLEVLKGDTAFYNYIVESNNSLGKRQVVNLAKIASFCRDPNLTELRQADMKRECLKFWEVPDSVRTAPPRVAPDGKCEEILRNFNAGSSRFLSTKEHNFSTDSMEKLFVSVYDWHCLVLGTHKDVKSSSTFYLGLGRNKVYKLDGRSWHKVEDTLDLSPDTLVYGQMVLEYKGEGKAQQKISALYIIDAICLGGEDITTKHLTERHKLCKLFVKALNKESRTDLTPIRVSALYDLECVDQIFDRLDQRIVKRSGLSMRLVYRLGEESDSRFLLPGGLIFLKATKEPWMRHLSRNTGYKYYYCQILKKSIYDNDRPVEACSNFTNTFNNRWVWQWDEDMHIKREGKALKNDLLQFVNRKCGKPQINNSGRTD